MKLNKLRRILAVLLAFACLAPAAEQSVHWSELDHLIAGKVISVRLETGKRLTGEALAVRADSIVVKTRTGERSIARASVRDIYIPRRPGHKWQTIGAAMGAGVGAAIAVPILIEAHNESGGLGRYGGVAIGLIAGLGVLGYLTGRSVDRSGDVIHILPD